MSHGQLTPEWSTPKLSESNQREEGVQGGVRWGEGNKQTGSCTHAWRPRVPRNKSMQPQHDWLLIGAT